MSIVKSKILDQLADNYPNFLRKDLEKALNLVFDEIARALSKQQNVEIRGFGTFKIKKQRARIGRNPKNSETIQIPEKKTIRWKMSKILYNRLNENFTENRISATN